MNDIFISYKREEQPVARRLADALENKGFSVWWDPKLRAGEHFDDAIERALNDAKCVIVMWSKLSIKSRYVKDEAVYALECKKLVPIAIEKVVLPIRFKNVQTAQLIGWDGSDSFPGYQKLVADIVNVIGTSPERGKNEKEDPSHLKPVKKGSPIIGKKTQLNKVFAFGFGFLALCLVLIVIGFYLYPGNKIERKKDPEDKSTKVLTTPKSPTKVPRVDMDARRNEITRDRDGGRAYPLYEPDMPTRTDGSPEELVHIVEWLDVESSEHMRYQAKQGSTYDDIYAYDYSRLAQAYLPRVWWTERALSQIRNGEKPVVRYGDTVRELNTNMIADWLEEYGTYFGWRKFAEVGELQTNANNGDVCFIVAQRQNLNLAGNITAVVPEHDLYRASRNTENEIICPLESHAGEINHRFIVFNRRWWEDTNFESDRVGFWCHQDPIKRLLLDIGVTQEHAKLFVRPLNDTMIRYEINTPLRRAHFLAQVLYETSRFRTVEENFNYSAQALLRLFPKYFTPKQAETYAKKPMLIASRIYGGRMGNGDEQSGDGYRYRGRGGFFIAGRSNYKKYSEYKGMDFVESPDRIATDPALVTDTAGWYWSNQNLNSLADLNDINKITEKINGGLNGLADRQSLFDKAIEIMQAE